MGTYIKPVTRINHIHATGIHFSLQLFSATIMILSGAFLLTLFVLSGAKVIGKGKDVFRQADFTEDIAIMGNGGSIFWLVRTEQHRQAASDACAKHGGKLASLNTQKKIDFVTSKVLDQSITRTWIGARCEKCETDQNVAEDKWFWENGEQLFVANDMWGTDGGKQTPYDNSLWSESSNDANNMNLCGLCELEL